MRKKLFVLLTNTVVTTNFIGTNNLRNYLYRTTIHRHISDIDNQGMYIYSVDNSNFNFVHEDNILYEHEV